MNLKNFLIFIVLGCASTAFAQSHKLQLRLQSTVDIALHEEGVDIEEIDLSGSNLTTDKTLNLDKDKVYKLLIDNNLKGYAYLGSAPSKERDFDYVIIFDRDLSIQKSKVLIYRETFGRQIETPRWLNQFNGMTPTSSPEFGKNIDGISGATISARSMTIAVNKALKAMNALQKNNLL